MEQELDNIRNKKVRGAVKKQKEMLKILNDKLKLMRDTRIKCEELAMTIGFLEGGAIRGLKGYLRKYIEDTDSTTYRANVENEVAALIAKADEKRKQEDLLSKVIHESEDKKAHNQMDEEGRYGHLSWLNKLIDMSQNQDLFLEKKVTNVSQLKEGMILDAQDYLDNWHLSIICKIQKTNESECVKVNFLPYPKGNRDEWLSLAEVCNRLSGPYSNIKQDDD